MGLFGSKSPRVESAPRFTTDANDWETHIRPLCFGVAAYHWTAWPCTIVEFVANPQKYFARLELARNDGLGRNFCFASIDLIGKVATSAREKTPEHKFVVGNQAVVYGIGDRAAGNLFYPVSVVDTEASGILFTYDWFATFSAVTNELRYWTEGVPEWGYMKPDEIRRSFLHYYCAVAEVSLRKQGFTGEWLVTDATRLGNEKFRLHWRPPKKLPRVS